MIPDKIFIDEDLIAFHVLQTEHDGDIEYIRKDSLLELIEEEMAFWDDGKMIFGQIIDKINSL